MVSSGRNGPLHDGGVRCERSEEVAISDHRNSRRVMRGSVWRWRLLGGHRAHTTADIVIRVLTSVTVLGLVVAAATYEPFVWPDVTTEFYVKTEYG